MPAKLAIVVSAAMTSDSAEPARELHGDSARSERLHRISMCVG